MIDNRNIENMNTVIPPTPSYNTPPHTTQPKGKQTNKYIIIGTTIMISILIILGLFIFRNTLLENGKEKETTISSEENIARGNVQEEITNPVEETKQENLYSSMETAQNILITNNAFQPTNLEIKQGEIVVWINQDKTEHIVKLGTEESQPLKEGEVYTKEFNQKGTYNYECKIHPNMEGTITVT